MNSRNQHIGSVGDGRAVLRMVLLCLLVVVAAGPIAGCGGTSAGESNQGTEPGAEASANSEEAEAKKREAAEATEAKKREAASELEAKKTEEANRQRVEAEAAEYAAKKGKKGSRKRKGGEKKQHGTKKSNGVTKGSATESGATAGEAAARKQFAKEEAAEVQAFTKLKRRETSEQGEGNEYGEAK
jgi:hypothetical protein